MTPDFLKLNSVKPLDNSTGVIITATLIPLTLGAGMGALIGKKKNKTIRYATYGAGISLVSIPLAVLLLANR